MICTSHMLYSLNHMLMANQQNPKMQIRWYNIYRENTYVACKVMILEPQGCNSTKKKKKKDTSCNLNSQHCIQERNEYNNRESFRTELGG